MTSTEETLRSPAGTSASAGTPFTAGFGASKSAGRAVWRTGATGPGTSGRRRGRRLWRTPSWTCGSSPQPGASVQVDTAHVSLFSGFTFKHFTACDVFTRWQVLEAHPPEADGSRRGRL